MSTTPFFIPDTSPLLAYSPEWVPAYHPKGNGYDETFHQITSGTGIVSFNLTASSIHFSTLKTRATPPICDAQYRINGSDWSDGCVLKDLPKGWHRVDMRPKGEGGMQFLGVGGQLRLGNENKYRNKTFDNLSSQFIYTDPSAWTLINSAGPLGAVQNQSVASAFGDKGGFYNQSLAVSSVAGAKAEFKFIGEAVYLYGISGADMGSAEIMIDGQIVTKSNMALPWRSYSSLLFMAGDLNATVEHTVTITNLVGGRTSLIDYAVVTVPGSSKAPANLGIILGSAAGGVIISLIICVILYICTTRRRTHRRSVPLRRTGSSNPGSIPYADTPKNIDLWRKISGGANSPLSPVSIAYSTPDSDRSRLTAQLVQMHRSPPPDYLGDDYPDYIPYNGPVEPRALSPASRRSESIRAPPDIVGASASATSWLKAQAVLASNRGSSQRSQRSLVSPAIISARSGNSSRSLTSPSGPGPSSARGNAFPIRPPPPARTGSRESGITSLDVPFTAIDYYSRSNPSSRPKESGGSNTPSPGGIRMSSFDLYSLALPTPTTATPSSATSAVSARNATITQATTSKMERSQSIDRSTGAYQQPMVSYDRRLKLDTIGLGGSRSTLTATSRSPPSAVPSSAALHSFSTSSSPTPLRRGPSIKSVRSFFSGLMMNGEIPALPNARPDSDLFGESVSVKRNPSGGPLRPQRRGEGVNASHGVGQLRLRETDESVPRNLFIELNPNSPMTVVSHRGSDQRGW